jgi:hypothetical protein
MVRRHSRQRATDSKLKCVIINGALMLVYRVCPNDIFLVLR